MKIKKNQTKYVFTKEILKKNAHDALHQDDRENFIALIKHLEKK